MTTTKGGTQTSDAQKAVDAAEAAAATAVGAFAQGVMPIPGVGVVVGGLAQAAMDGLEKAFASLFPGPDRRPKGSGQRLLNMAAAEVGLPAKFPVVTDAHQRIKPYALVQGLEAQVGVAVKLLRMGIAFNRLANQYRGSKTELDTGRKLNAHRFLCAIIAEARAAVTLAAPDLAPLVNVHDIAAEIESSV